ncbi:GerAB/ArcD/ProY family transporter [Aquibacillus rhizosphaerae]|uniref:Endospore germination permease n=1 Tax=Aquibacillus rhizosphaerae TaxID=3051431 RepID=A0ABT7L3Y5_9BACI|nr:endospore germination permease [Aquibacillus sp. LR5S19]MDL4840578.1 endospore germination permease [Aquibacillus sp. LR5S19]
MNQSVQISGRQFTILIIMNILGTAVIIVPAIATGYGKQNGWASVLLITFFTMIMVLLYNRIYTQNPNKNLYEQMEYLFGKWIGKIVSILFMIYVFEIAIGNLRVMGDFITTEMLIETPLEVIMILSIITCLSAIRLGIEVIARTAEIFFPYVVIAILLLISLVMPESDITNIQPVLQTDISSTLAGALPLMGYPFLEIVILLAVMNNVTNRKAPKNFLIGVFIGGLLLTLITIMCVLVLGPDITTRNAYPTYALGKKISIADFLERIEILVAIIWFFTIFFKITSCFYVLAIGLSQTLQLKSYKTLTIPLTYLLLVSAAHVTQNVIATSQFLNSTWISVSITFGIILPLLLFIVGLIKKRH